MFNSLLYSVNNSMLRFLLQITPVLHLTSSNSRALTPIRLTHALPLELLCQISCCNIMVSAKKKRAQRQKQYMKNKDAAKVDMKEYYENNKSPIKLSQNEEQNKVKNRVGISGMKKIRMLKG